MRLAKPVSKKVSNSEVRIKAAIFVLRKNPDLKAPRENTGPNLRGSDPSLRQNTGSLRLKQGLCG